MLRLFTRQSALDYAKVLAPILRVLGVIKHNRSKLIVITLGYGSNKGATTGYERFIDEAGSGCRPFSGSFGAKHNECLLSI